MANLMIIPEKTQDLMNVFDNTDNKWYPWSRTEVGGLGFQNYEEWMEAFKRDSIYFKDLGNTTHNPYQLHSFEATIIVAAYPHLIYGMDNSQSKSPQTIAYQQSVGLESSSSLEVGVSFNLGFEFGNALAKVSAEMGFSVNSSTTETVRTLETMSLEAVVDPGDSVYLYQLAYKLVRVKGYVARYPGGAWVGVVGGQSSATDFSPIYLSRHDPLG